MNEKFLTFDILSGLSSPAERCSIEQFNATVDSAAVKRITNSIAEDYKLMEAGKITNEEFTKRKTEKKKGLPAFTFQAHFVDGKRHNDSAEPSNLAIFDVDNCANREAAEEAQRKHQAQLQSLGLLDEAIALMHTTPSGKGYRIVFRMPEGLNIPQAQRWLASKLGIKEFDTSCKDYARLSFAVPREYITYLNENVLFSESIRPFSIPAEEAALFRKEELPKAPAEAVIPEQTAALPTDWKAGFPEGITLADILPHYWTLAGGEPQVGERNQKLFQLAKDAAVYFEFHEEAMRLHLPTYGLEEAEMKQLIHSACSYRNYFSSKRFKRAIGIAEAQREMEKGDATRLPQMPKRLPQLIWLLVQKTPKEYRPIVAHAVFPALATHLWKVYFRYIDNVWHEATLMNVLVGSFSQGKSCIDKPIQYIMEDITKRDQENYLQLREWINTKKNSNLFEKIPPKPELCIQKILSNCTSAEFNNLGENAQGRFLYTKVNEIGLLNGLQGVDGKSGAYELIKAAFDNAEWGQHRASEEAVNAKFNLHFNFNASTTPGKAKQYFKNALTDGTLSRLTFTWLDNQPIGAPMPQYGEYDEKYCAKLKPYIDNLNRARGKIECKEAIALVQVISEKIKDRTIYTQDRVYDDLSHRAVVIGYLMACVLYVANGCKWEKEIEDFIAWAVDYDLYAKMQLFGDAIRREMQLDATRYTPVSLFDSLNPTFTYEEYCQARRKQGLDNSEKAAKDLLRQWTHRRKIERCDSVTSDTDSYRKIA